MRSDREKGHTGAGSQELAKVAMALFWTSGYIVGALATAHTPALTVTFWRFAAAAPLMAAIALTARVRWPRGREIGYSICVGVSLQAVQFIGAYGAIGRGVPAGLVALLAGASPVLVAIAGALLFEERLERRQWIGSGIGLLGVVFAVADEMHGALTIAGLLLALLGLAGLTGGTLVQRHRGGAVDPRGSNVIQLIAAGMVMAPLVALGPGFEVERTYRALAPLVWLTLGLSVCAILVFFWLLERQKGGEATSFLYVVPSLTAIAAVPVLGQPLSPGVIVGLVLGLVGVNLVGARSGRALRGPPRSAATRSRRRSRRPARAWSPPR